MKKMGSCYLAIRCRTQAQSPKFLKWTFALSRYNLPGKAPKAIRGAQNHPTEAAKHHLDRESLPCQISRNSIWGNKNLVQADRQNYVAAEFIITKRYCVDPFHLV